jgi:hypothetical protein
MKTSKRKAMFAATIDQINRDVVRALSKAAITK